MRVTYDPEKRERTLEDSGRDFDDAQIVFAGVTLEVEDKRKDYGEVRIVWLWAPGGPWLATHRVARIVTSLA
jgi:uncharacterized DUF497 family protein